MSASEALESIDAVTAGPGATAATATAAAAAVSSSAVAEEEAAMAVGGRLDGPVPSHAEATVVLSISRRGRDSGLSRGLLTLLLLLLLLLPTPRDRNSLTIFN
jgi:hypothetical protein